MTKQSIIWTALPNGILKFDNNVTMLKISVFVSPRLYPEATEEHKLGIFKDFKNWPEKVRDLRFDIYMDGRKLGRVSVRECLSISKNELDDALWNSLFNDTTLVQPHEFDNYGQRNYIVSYPVKVLHDYLKNLYPLFGTKYDGEVPSIKKILDDPNNEIELCKRNLFGLNGRAFRAPKYLEYWQSIDNAVAGWTERKAEDVLKIFRKEQQEGFTQPPPNNDIEKLIGPLNKFLAFHSPPKVFAKIPKNDADLHKHEYKGFLEDYVDFHQAVSSLSDYPMVMRKLGLVIDLFIDSRLVPINASGRFSGLKLDLPGSSLAQSSLYPETACIWDGSNRFEAACKEMGSDNKGILEGRVLNLDPEKYELIQTDVDGGIFKLIGMIRSFQKRCQLNSSCALEMEDISLASLRSAGISIVENDRGAQTFKKFKRAFEINSSIKHPQKIELLYAEDLIQGYRVDVWDSDTDEWHSLCHRVGKYDFRGIEKNISDEGFVQMGLTKNPTSSNDIIQDFKMNLHESIMRWDGWSLCAPRPGKCINRLADPSASPEDFQNNALTPFGLSVNFSAPTTAERDVPPDGLLPKLRFGTNYRIRLRPVDLAGNSLKTNEVSDRISMPRSKTDFAYLRFEPVKAPEVVLRKMLNPVDYPGESLERLVIRSRNISCDLDSQRTIDNSERHIAPPRTNQLTAEVHGLFDSQSGGLKMDGETYKMIKIKDEGKFEQMRDTSVNPPVDVPIEQCRKLELPYLPDPLSLGASIRGLPGTENGTFSSNPPAYRKAPRWMKRFGSVTNILFGQRSKWPQAEPFRFKLEEGSGEPQWDESERVLTVFLPKSEMTTVTLSSFFRPSDLKLMAIWKWIREYWEKMTAKGAMEIEPYASSLVDLDFQAVNGGFWMLTPSRKLTLVHAVQQPIGKPRFMLITANRAVAPKGITAVGTTGLGSTAVGLEGWMEVHGKSTSKVDIMAQWDEPIDKRGEDTWPSLIHCQAHVEEIPLSDLEGKGPLTSGGKPVGFYRPESDIIIFKGGITSTIISSIFPSLNLSSVPDAWPIHEMHDTKHRKISYKAVATSRFREYFDQNKGLNFARTSEEFVLNVPSSARPASPEVAYVLPTFDRKEMDVRRSMIASLCKGGLRVYLEGPWFSSGEGELLGVVMAQRDPNVNYDDVNLINMLREGLKPYITQWGMDPLRLSKSTGMAPVPNSFPSRVAEAYDLNLEGLPNLKVSVAGHEVNYDKEQDRLYCDIDIDAGSSYYPFIRLALARYQPHSIAGAHLSKVFLADYAQISPVRSVVVTHDPSNPGERDVTISGPSYTYMQNIANVLEVTLEENKLESLDELGWEEARDTIVAEASVTDVENMLLFWKGKIVFPATDENRCFRLVIKEFEMLLVDDIGGSVPQTNKRLVYAESIQLV